MKNRLLFIFLAAVAALCSCKKDLEETPGILRDDTQKATVSLSLEIPGETMSKAASDYETGGTIKGKIQIFVFNSNGTWDAGKSFSVSDADANGKFTLECTVGKGKHIHVIANAPAMSSVTSEDMLISQKFDLNTIKSTTGLPMYGYLESDITASSDVKVQIKRMVAKVIVKKIVLGSGFKAGGTLALNDMYILNAPGEVNYVKRTASEDLTDWASIKWYNKLKYSDGTFASLHTAFTNITDLKTTPYNGTSWFYILPNKYVNDDARGGSTWSARPSRLSIKATFTPTGKSPITYYYPITINPKDASGKISAPIEANKVYTFESITINHLGSTSDDNPVTAADVKFTVSVADWVEMPAVNPTL